jgi:hypothetical protein
MTTAPSQVVIRCTLDDEPFAGAYVTLSLPMWSKNQYALLFGPSDERGVISVTRDELMRSVHDDEAAFPMDYASFPDEWSGGIGAAVLDAAGVQRLRDAITLWGDGHLPPALAADLDGYEKHVQPVAHRRLAADVAHTA